MIAPHYDTEHATLYLGDCLDVLRELPDASVHAVVTDPPYAIDFMGSAWDSAQQMRGALAVGDEQRGAFAYGGTHSRGYADHDARVFQAWCEQWATECLRILRPGGHLLAFGGTRTFHRLAAGIEDAGFEIRDSIAWLYGSGFPKSLDVAKAIDKAAGAERPVLATIPDRWAGRGSVFERANQPAGETVDLTAAATEAAKAWQGWGTALKPAFEPVVVARKPLAGTVATNVLAHGTGALHIDACRIGTDGGTRGTNYAKTGLLGIGGKADIEQLDAGRWPANVILDESQAAELDRQAPDTGASGRVDGPSLRQATEASVAFGARNGWDGEAAFYGDRGGASRFFYSPKAPQHERPQVDGVAHPTVKPIDLMRWLVRLVTPPGGTVLEPFAGSGSTVEAALTEGFHVIAIEREASYMPLIEARMRRPMQGTLFDF